MRRLLLCALSSLARANPNINLPVNAQVPPVARAGQPFHFTFSDSTFTSPSELLSYSLAGAPTWLSLDGPGRTLSGIPTSEDTGAPVMELIASDAAGSTVMSITLVVTQEGGPGPGLPLADQLQANAAFAAPNSILVAPLGDISISLAPNAFTNASSDTVYYAVRDDRTPLPSWIGFNPSSLSFSGVAPPAPPATGGTQNFSFEVTASDVVGFSDAVLPFQIVVEPSLFIFKSNLQIINVSPGMFLNDSSTLLNALTLNGTRVSPSMIQNVSASLPPWLHMNTDGLALRGTPPADFKSLNFTVEITDSYNTSTSTVVALSYADSPNGLLLKPLGTVAVEVGCNFTYDLHQAATDADVTFQVDFGSSSAWLEYDQISKTIIGRFPSSVRPQQVFANVTAQRGSEIQSEILTISLLNVHSTSTAKEASPASKPSTPPYPGKRGWVAAAVVIPVAAILALVLAVFLRWRKTGRQWSERNRVASSFQTSEKSIVNHRAGHESLDSIGGAMMSGGLGRRSLSRISLPPRIPWPWSQTLDKHESRCQSSRTSFSDLVQRFAPNFPSSAALRSKPLSEFSHILEEKQRGTRKDYVPPIEEAARETSSGYTPSSDFGIIRRYPQWSTIGSSFSFVGKRGHRNRTSNGPGHEVLMPGRGHGSGLLSQMGHNLRSPGFGVMQSSWATLHASQSTSDWSTTTGDSVDRNGPHHSAHRYYQRPTIRPVLPSAAHERPSTTFWSPSAHRIPDEPQNSKTNARGNPFLSGRATGPYKARRSRIPSLSPQRVEKPLDSRRESSPERRHRLFDHGLSPRVIDVHREPLESLYRMSDTSLDSRFQSAAPSIIGLDSLQEYEPADRTYPQDSRYFNPAQARRVSNESVQPGLLAAVLASRRDSGPLRELKNRFTRIAPHFDDDDQEGDGSISTGGSVSTSHRESSVNVGWTPQRMSQRQMTRLCEGEPASRSMQGEIKECGSSSFL